MGKRTDIRGGVAEAISESADADAMLHGLCVHPEARATGTLASGVEQILLAAYETTTMMLAWTIDLLARHPVWQEPCAEETVAERVVSDSLRLYPPTWLFVRVATEDDVLPSDAEATAGTKMYLSPYVSQRSAAAFVAASTFDPPRPLGLLTLRPVRPIRALVSGRRHPGPS